MQFVAVSDPPAVTCINPLIVRFLNTTLVFVIVAHPKTTSVPFSSPKRTTGVRKKMDWVIGPVGVINLCSISSPGGPGTTVVHRRIGRGRDERIEGLQRGEPSPFSIKEPKGRDQNPLNLIVDCGN